jgi:hypothetical protein
MAELPRLHQPSPALAPGEHTLTLIATGRGSEQASGVDIDVDRMLVRP